MYDVKALRQTEFPNSATLTYLNHAGVSPLPQRTKREVQNAAEALSGNANAFFGTVALPAFDTVRADLAGLLNAASAADIALSTSTSAALNGVAQSIAWRPGDNIIFCDQEFPSNAYPWMSLARDGVEARPIPTEHGGLTVRALESYVDDKTRAVAVSAVQFFSGHRADLMALGRFCHQRGILFIVDAIQAIGHMPIDVEAMHIDVLASGGMKSLLALPGAGVLYVRRSLADQMEPRMIHGNSTVDYLHWLKYDLTPQPGAARLSAGTPNLVGVLSIAASLSLIRELGPANIDAHTTALTHYAIDILTDEGYEVVTPREFAGPITTFRSRHDSETTDRLVQFLAEQQIIVCKHLDAAGAPYIRASVHCYNVREDIDRLVEGLEAFAG